MPRLATPASGSLLFLLIAAAAALPAQAQLDGIAACRSIAERKARYACYDSAETALAPAAPAAAVAEAPAATIAATPLPVAPAAQAAVEDFGKPQARLEADEQGKAELVDRVAGLKEVQHRQWQITLESGQVWRQMLSQAYNLREGYEVRISQIGDGASHRLTSPQLAGNIQVRRVR